MVSELSNGAPQMATHVGTISIPVNGNKENLMAKEYLLMMINNERKSPGLTARSRREIKTCAKYYCLNYQRIY